MIYLEFQSLKANFKLTNKNSGWKKKNMLEYFDNIKHNYDFYLPVPCNCSGIVKLLFYSLKCMKYLEFQSLKENLQTKIKISVL